MNKILVFLIQLPPSLQIAEGLDLINLQYQLDPSFRYAIEVRHYSWFNELFYNYKRKEVLFCIESTRHFNYSSSCDYRFCIFEIDRR
jgi:uncharacterized protein YecE (DUF72 family)